MIYIGLINITVYTPNGMTCYSTFHPFGEKYTYEDMLNIYDIIKKEYKKKYDNILKKSLTIDCLYLKL